MEQLKSSKGFLNILFQILFFKWVRGGPNYNIQASLKPKLKSSSCLRPLNGRTTSICQSPHHPQALLKRFFPKPHTRLTSLMVVWTAVRSVLQAGRLAVARRIASLSGAFCSCFFCRENDSNQKSTKDHEEYDNEHGTAQRKEL